MFHRWQKTNFLISKTKISLLNQRKAFVDLKNYCVQNFHGLNLSTNFEFRFAKCLLECGCVMLEESILEEDNSSKFLHFDRGLIRTGHIDSDSSNQPQAFFLRSFR